jgi:hypothetical protein
MAESGIAAGGSRPLGGMPRSIRQDGLRSTFIPLYMGRAKHFKQYQLVIENLFPKMAVESVCGSVSRRFEERAAGAGDSGTIGWNIIIYSRAGTAKTTRLLPQ